MAFDVAEIFDPIGEPRTAPQLIARIKALWRQLARLPERDPDAHVITRQIRLYADLYQAIYEPSRLVTAQPSQEPCRMAKAGLRVLV